MMRHKMVFSSVIDRSQGSSPSRKATTYNGQPIRLIGCNAGQGSYGLARNLSSKLGVEVLAPTGKAYVEANGKFGIKGEWRRFFPGGW